MLNWKIADKEGIDVRQSYSRAVKKLSWQQRFSKTKNGAKDARKANKKIKTIAGRLVRELSRKLPLDHLGTYLPSLKLYQRVLSQKRADSNKVYSLHEPDVKCYSKGKEHKKFEFGSKVSILVDQGTGVIMGALNFPSPQSEATSTFSARVSFTGLKRRPKGLCGIVSAKAEYCSKAGFKLTVLTCCCIFN